MSVDRKVQKKGLSAIEKPTTAPTRNLQLQQLLAGLPHREQLQRLQPPRPFGSQPVQSKSASDDTGAAAVKNAAAAGVSGGGQPLPFLDKIQSSMPGHDLSNVQAHVGGKAAEACSNIGASAYATGNDVAFKKAPDLHTTAHEAAHVVQQRRVVQLKDGVGQAGDRYEQHADAVADAVVQGRSVEGMLGKAEGCGGGDGVQMLMLQLKSLQFNPPGSEVEGSDESTSDSTGEGGVDVDLQSGIFGSFEATLTIPLPAGFSVELTVKVGAAGEQERGEWVFKIDGDLQFKLELSLLFFTIALTAGIFAKIAVRMNEEPSADNIDRYLDHSDESSYLSRGLQEIGMWWGARELNNLDERNQQLRWEYNLFQGHLVRLIDDLHGNDVEALISSRLGVCEDILGMCDDLIDDVTDIYDDVSDELEINESEIVDKSFFRQQLENYWRLLTANQDRNVRQDTIDTQIITAQLAPLYGYLDGKEEDVANLTPDDLNIVNDPDVGIEIGYSFGLELGVNASEESRLEGSYTHVERASDPLGATEFDTETEGVEVYRIAGEHSFSVGGETRQFSFEFEYEDGESEDKIKFSVSVGQSSGEYEPNEDNVESVLTSTRENILNKLTDGIDPSNLATEIANTISESLGSEELWRAPGSSSENNASRLGGEASGEIGLEFEMSLTDGTVTGGHLRLVMSHSLEYGVSGGGGAGFEVTLTQGSYLGIGVSREE